MTINPVRTWGQTTRYADAMEDIIELMAGFLPPDSGIGTDVVVSEIIAIIELRAQYRFVGPLRLVPYD